MKNIHFSLFVHRKDRNGCYHEKSYLFLQEDGRIDSAALCAQLASREILVAMLEGTDATILNVVLGYTTVQKNLLVAERKIDMPLQGLNDITFGSQAITLSRICREGSIRALLCNLFHRKGSLLKSLIYLISHLKTVERNTWTYHRLQLLGICLIGKSHLLKSLVNDASQGPSPSGMDGGDSMMLLIIKKHRDAIGSRNANAYTSLIGHYCIYAFKYHLTDILWHGKKLICDITHLYSMYLMRHDEMGCINTQLCGKTLAVFSHMFCIVTAKLIDIKFAIVALAYSILTGSRESLDASGYIIFLYHLMLSVKLGLRSRNK